MPEKTTPPDNGQAPQAAAGERIAKVLSRRGIASRREAERLIEAGEVTVNGKTIASPALNVTGADRITVSGKLLPEEEQARLWLYYKPEGLVTSAADEKGRDTVFDHLPEDMPRVMSVGRLDLNSEGLLLLTNDGGLKRRLELPSTGWLRKYRVRVNGRPEDQTFQPLREGITIEGEKFKPMQVTLDRQQGANAWLTVGLREGRNREIRRAMNAIGLYVNRLIRVSYGPFRLNDLQPGQVEEVKSRILRDQLGEIDQAGSEAADAPPARKRPALARVRGGKAASAPDARPPGARPGVARPDTSREGGREGGRAANPRSGKEPATAERSARATGRKFGTTGGSGTQGNRSSRSAEPFSDTRRAAGPGSGSGSGSGSRSGPATKPGTSRPDATRAGAAKPGTRKPAPKPVSTRNAPAPGGARGAKAPGGKPHGSGGPTGRGPRKG